MTTKHNYHVSIEKSFERPPFSHDRHVVFTVKVKAPGMSRNRRFTAAEVHPIKVEWTAAQARAYADGLWDAYVDAGHTVNAFIEMKEIA